VGNAAKRDAAAAVRLHHCRYRDQRERVGGAVAHLVIEVLAAQRLRQGDRRDQLTRRQGVFDMWGGTRQAIKIGDRDHARGSVGAHRFNAGVEQLHGHRHVARVGCYAGLALADDRVAACIAADGRAAAARIAFVAGLVGIVEIRAAGALQQVAGSGRLVAQLGRGACHESARKHRVVAPYPHVGGQIGIAHQGADAQSAIRCRLDLVQAQAVDVDQVRRRLDLEFHEVEQVGAAGDEARAWYFHDRCRGFGRRSGAFVGKGPHDFAPALDAPPASVIASMMFE
jgi:hypothetical protein